MNEDTPLLSIIIPTRNRLEYVKSAIESILKINSTKLQLVVEDNSNMNELEFWLREKIKDERLLYHHSTAILSMVENYDKATSRAIGEYCCLIGDDDGVNPEIIAATEWAKKNGIDALVPSSTINFVWPDLQMTSLGSMEPGELSIRYYRGDLTYPDPEEEVRRCVEDAGQKFHMLPKVYYGVVKKSCLDNVKSKTGTFFPGVSPDMSSAISVAIVAKKICYVDYPLFVPGSSAKSNAGLSGLKKHIGKLRDQPHLPQNCEENWSDIVPLFYSVPTIWAESTVNALSQMGRFDLLRKFNVPLLYATCSVFHYRYMQGMVKKYYNSLTLLGQKRIRGTFLFFFWFFYWWSLRAKSLIFRLVGEKSSDNSYHKGGLKNIDEAVKSVTEYLIKSKVSFKDVFR